MRGPVGRRGRAGAAGARPTRTGASPPGSPRCTWRASWRWGGATWTQATRLLDEARQAGESRWGSCSASPPRCGAWPSAAARAGTTQAAVELTEAGYAAVARGRRRRQPVPDAGHRDPGPARRSGPGRRPGVGRPGLGATCAARGIPGTLPAVDHAAGLVAAGRRPDRQGAELLGAAHDGWTARRPVVGGPVVRARPGPLRAGVQPPDRGQPARGAGPRGRRPPGRRRPCSTRADAAGVRLDEHDAVQPWSPLTLRELEVARLVAQGPDQPRDRRGARITVRTAGSHLEHIGAKLGAGRRTEIATWVTSLDRVD